MQRNHNYPKLAAKPRPCFKPRIVKANTQRTSVNVNGHAVPVYNVDDLLRMGKSRKDATLFQIWPNGLKRPAANVFYFEMIEGGKPVLRPSILL